jgi:hypothetical protein
MTDIFHCGDAATLIGYLYDDCEPDERDAIAAHVLSCRACSEELEALKGTRQQLSAWTPPDALLGFRITRDALDAENGRVIRDSRSGEGSPSARPSGAVWWQRPMPAWAQLAAAALVFAAGLAVGGARSSNASAGVATPSAVPASDATVAEMRNTLASLEQRLAGIEQQGPARTVAAVSSLPADQIVTVPRLREMQQEFAVRMVELASIQSEGQTAQNQKLEVSNQRLATLENYVPMLAAAVR